MTVRNGKWECLFCGKAYRREFALLNHETKCIKRPPSGVEVARVEATPAPMTKTQKLMADSQEIALEIMRRSINQGRLDWSFETRRRLETTIEAAITEKLFTGRPDLAPRVRLVRDRKTKLVSLELEPREKKRWDSRLEPKSEPA